MLYELSHFLSSPISLLLWKKSWEKDKDVKIPAAVLPGLNHEDGKPKGRAPHKRTQPSLPVDSCSLKWLRAEMHFC